VVVGNLWLEALEGIRLGVEEEVDMLVKVVSNFSGNLLKILQCFTGGPVVPLRSASPLPPNVPTGPRNQNKYKDRDGNAPAVDGLDYGGNKDHGRMGSGEPDDRGSRQVDFMRCFAIIPDCFLQKKEELPWFGRESGLQTTLRFISSRRLYFVLPDTF
jgi:hypothetical protein